MTGRSRLGLGIDVGTQGARVVVADDTGRVLARAQEAWPIQPGPSTEREQDPDLWWEAIVRSVRAVLGDVDADAIDGVSVAATSGTLVLTDGSLRPLRPAMMWNDKRASTEADAVNAALAQHPPAGYVAPQRPTSTLAKALWVREHERGVWASTRHILSAGDWILARLTGEAPVADVTNVLKSGYDLDASEWPSVIDAVGIDAGMLPEVVAPATPVGRLSPASVDELGLASRTVVVAGVTDANAAQIAGGAVSEGDWLTTIGTGLSVKGVSSVRLSDETGALYSHRHWDGGWIPSATSHCGADSIAQRFAGEDLRALTAEAARRRTSSVLVLPLATIGEYFPFSAPDATGFELGAPDGRGDLFRGYLEGIAFVERLIMERIEAAGALATGAQLTMGGGASNLEWLRIRAAVLGRPVARTSETSSAFGAAVLALSGAPEHITERAHAMAHRTVVIDPDPESALRYAEREIEWRRRLLERGYLREPLTEGTGG